MWIPCHVNVAEFSKVDVKAEIQSALFVVSLTGKLPLSVKDIGTNSGKKEDSII